MSKILVVQGHPDPASLCASLAKAYAESAKSGGHEVRMLALPDLAFDPILRGGFSGTQPLEPDLVAAQASITWAEHIVIAYPVWWGAPPALLKGFIDRTFLPGFAFKYRPTGALWDKLLTGKSARLLVTADSPGWYLALVTGNPAVKVVKKSTLDFCGVSPVHVTLMPTVRRSKPDLRASWIEEARRLGASGA